MRIPLEVLVVLIRVRHKGGKVKAGRLGAPNNHLKGDRAVNEKDDNKLNEEERDILKKTSFEYISQIEGRIDMLIHVCMALINRSENKDVIEKYLSNVAVYSERRKAQSPGGASHIAGENETLLIMREAVAFESLDQLLQAEFAPHQQGH